MVPATMSDPQFSGMIIRTNPLLTVTEPYPRSPARAKRRAALGHRQHYRTVPSSTVYQLPGGILIMHPAIADQLTAVIQAQATTRS